MNGKTAVQMIQTNCEPNQDVFYVVHESWGAEITNGTSSAGRRFTEVTVFRNCPSGGPCSVFRPEDVLDAPCFVQELATALARRAFVSRELADDLLCLASCLDYLTGKDRASEPQSASAKVEAEPVDSGKPELPE